MARCFLGSSRRGRDRRLGLAFSVGDQSLLEDRYEEILIDCLRVHGSQFDGSFSFVGAVSPSALVETVW